MDLEKLSKLNKHFANQTNEMNNEFIELFLKWKKKNPRLSIFNAVHLPLNLILNLLEDDKNSLIPHLVKDFPGIFGRFLNPFNNIQDKWGKIPSKKFVELYHQEYEKQFDQSVVDNEKKQAFKDWYSKRHNKVKIIK